jgi:hypothetical protein
MPELVIIMPMSIKAHESGMMIAMARELHGIFIDWLKSSHPELL